MLEVGDLKEHVRGASAERERRAESAEIAEEGLQAFFSCFT
jgi:hypothetical protein